ncbi:hypothetical protein EJ08DRAFT_662645 [Tothia fuscella]|uniref:Uncharacterized protein n=1 Tax=Tothia fuscella TaxID=1048955 RepID=A0A9P4NMK6_9PEZI|nr:hypothetical protein EJ08DRAFT_662645 [Tothia fuscella]
MSGSQPPLENLHRLASTKVSDSKTTSPFCSGVDHISHNPVCHHKKNKKLPDREFTWSTGVDEIFGSQRDHSGCISPFLTRYYFMGYRLTAFDIFSAAPLGDTSSYFRRPTTNSHAVKFTISWDSLVNVVAGVILIFSSPDTASIDMSSFTSFASTALGSFCQVNLRFHR